MLRLILEDFDAKKIAESGQYFRMTCQDDHTVQVIAFGNVLTIYERGENVWDFSCTQKEFDTVWKEYFDLDTDYSGYRGLCLPEDAFLKEALEAGMGIRILRQDPWEMLVSFIISQRKSIPAIRTAVELLCTRFGTPFEYEIKRIMLFPHQKESPLFLNRSFGIAALAIARRMCSTLQAFFLTRLRFRSTRFL